MNQKQVQKKGGDYDDDDDYVEEEPDEDQANNYALKKADFQYAYQQMTDNLIKGLHTGQEGNIQLLLISDKDLLKYNDRMMSQT